MPALEESELSVDLDGLGADPVAFGRASYVMELVERLLPEAMPEPALFALVEETLELLAAGQGSSTLLRAFELRLLRILGSLPDLSGPADDPEASVCAYDANAGELLATPSPASIPFTDAAALLARALLQCPLDDLPEPPRDVLKVVGRIFAVYLRRNEIGPLRSVGYLKALQAPQTEWPKR